MESRIITEMPKTNRGMTEELQETLETIQNMQVGEIREFSDEKRTPESIINTLRNLKNRLPRNYNITLRRSPTGVCVKREKDKQ